MDTIEFQDWVKQYTNLWRNDNQITQEEETMKRKGLDPISVQELEEALSKTKQKKASGLEGISAELLKYG